MKMNTKLLVALLAAIGLSLALGVGKASAWLRDPDTMSTTAVLAQLAPPDPTIGDSDTTAVGVGDDAVGADSQAAPTADPPDPKDFYVDNTPMNGDCPATPYTTIQSAVNASGPGATIKVCPGTYPEQVRITGHNHDKLKLESLKPLKATIQWPTVESAPLALVDFNTADQVTLRGFVVSGPFTFPSCSPDRHEGLLVENAFDANIERNHITQIRNSNAATRLPGRRRGFHRSSYGRYAGRLGRRPRQRDRSAAEERHPGGSKRDVRPRRPQHDRGAGAPPAAVRGAERGRRLHAGVRAHRPQHDQQ